jgi:large subunit ribosomal protein L20
MGNFSRLKVLKLAKGFKGKSRTCYSVAIRKVHKALKYQYRDRRQKKRVIRKNWIISLNAATKEHGLNYSRFIMCLNRSNIILDRKILAELSINEPYSFKSIIDEVKKQNNFSELDKQTPKLTK